jgi:hypothetical protein
MGKHHHHPHEGHGSGTPPSRKPMHHDWRFYAAGLAILIALLIYLLSGDLAFQPRLTPVPQTPIANGH